MPTDQQPSLPLDSAGWLTVRWLDSRPDDPSEVGFRDLLVHAHRIAGLAVGPPPALSALYRVLYALTARVTGLDTLPKDSEEWFDLRYQVAQEGIPEKAVDSYLGPRSPRFDLFGPTPFLQDPRLRDQCPKTSGLNKLVLGRSAGNNHAWFGNHRDADPHPLRSSEAVLHLLTWLYYGPSGRCSTRTVRTTTAAQVYAGPLRSSLSYHPEGRSLLHTLLAGLTRPKPSDSREHDLCPWEADPEHDPLTAPEVYRGPCSRLTGGWQHAVLLVPSADGHQVTDAYVTWASPHRMPPTDDAYVIWQFSKKDNLYARPADSGRALWRDVDSLLLEESTGSNQARRPLVFGTALKDDFPGLRVRALGFEQDGKTQDVQFVSATTPTLLDLLKAHRRDTARRIGDTRQIAERYGYRLDKAVKQAWAGIADGTTRHCAWAEEAKARYWPAAEHAFWDIVLTRDFDRASKTFLNLARRAFERVTNDAARTCHAMAAREEARLQLYGGRRRSPRTPAASAQQPSQGNTMTTTTSPTESTDTPEYTFVRTVHKLCNAPGNRQALASGLRRPLDRCLRMHALIAEEIPEEDQRRGGTERAYYAIAAMIASLPPAARRAPSARQEGQQDPDRQHDETGASPPARPKRRRDFGICLAEAVARAPHRERALEDRLDLLAKQSLEGIHRHLPGVVAFIADHPDAVNWTSLLRDLRDWEPDRDRITRRWLQSYYRERKRAAAEAAARADIEDPTDGDHDSPS